jgi:hypothetical protein
MALLQAGQPPQQPAGASSQPPPTAGGLLPATLPANWPLSLLGGGLPAGMLISGGLLPAAVMGTGAPAPPALAAHSAGGLASQALGLGGLAALASGLAMELPAPQLLAEEAASEQGQKRKRIPTNAAAEAAAEAAAKPTSHRGRKHKCRSCGRLISEGGRISHCPWGKGFCAHLCIVCNEPMASHTAPCYKC